MVGICVFVFSFYDAYELSNYQFAESWAITIVLVLVTFSVSITFTVPFQAQNSPFPQIFSNIDC